MTPTQWMENLNVLVSGIKTCTLCIIIKRFSISIFHTSVNGHPQFMSESITVKGITGELKCFVLLYCSVLAQSLKYGHYHNQFLDTSYGVTFDRFK